MHYSNDPYFSKNYKPLKIVGCIFAILLIFGLGFIIGRVTKKDTTSSNDSAINNTKILSEESTNLDSESSGINQNDSMTQSPTKSEYNTSETTLTVTATPTPTFTSKPTNTTKPTNVPTQSGAKGTATQKPTVPPKATATPKPTATAKPKATATPRPTITTKPKATATPKPRATATPRPTNASQNPFLPTTKPTNNSATFKLPKSPTTICEYGRDGTLYRKAEIIDFKLIPKFSFNGEVTVEYQFKYKLLYTIEEDPNNEDHFYLMNPQVGCKVTDSSGLIIYKNNLDAFGDISTGETILANMLFPADFIAGETYTVELYDIKR